jgi:CubicO group peptidase (beta-lactamase class C family)
MVFRKFQIVLFSLSLAVGCAVTAQALDEIPVEDVGAGRVRLGFQELMSAKITDEAPIDNRHFVASAGAASALEDFSGILKIPELPMNSIRGVITPHNLMGKKPGLFPATSISFFTSGEYLVPAVRDIVTVKDNESFWQIQVSPGRVWSEPLDHGYSRASFPFMLTSHIGMESHNGLATFLYKGDSVSQLRYQLVQQSSPFLVAGDLFTWNQVPVKYLAGPVEDEKALVQAFRIELAARLPIKPWAALTEQYAAVPFGNFESTIESDKTITTGLIIDDVIYVKPSRTRYGDFPYPEEMRHGVWSVTKSAFGLVCMLRIAQKYGDGVFDLKLKDYLDIPDEYDGWNKVTFGHALSMTTGIGTGTDNVNPNNITDGYLDDANDMADYNAWWYGVFSAKEKLPYVYRNRNHPWGPGEFVRYRDRDVYILSHALSNLLKEKEGPGASLSDMMSNEVYKPIGIHHMAFTRTVEEPGETDVPHFGWGLYMNVDDIAKVARLLHNGGRHSGEQLLSENRLKEALYQTDTRGLPTGRSNQFGEKSYHMSFWHSPFKTDKGLEFSIPEMHGYGGMLVSLLPNGMTGFRLGNGGFVPHEAMTDAAHSIRPFGPTP